MKTGDSQTPLGLRALCQQAGERAEGWHAGTGTGTGGDSARAAAPALLRRKPLLQAGLVGSLSVLALAVVAAQFRSEPASAGAAVPVPKAVPPQAAQLSLSLPAPVAASPSEPVRWQDGELMIDFDEVPLPQAITLLARATDTAVAGVELLRRPVPVTLHWRFSDARAAWLHLLQSHAGFGITCGASSCRVWITGEVGVPAAANTPGADGALPGATAAPADTAPTEYEMSQPDGSC